jgi:hypothetical protein
MSDWDIRKKDLRQRYAGFARLPVSLDAHSVLQYATACCRSMYGDGFIGDKVWLKYVADVTLYDAELGKWVYGLADSIGGCHSSSGKVWVKRYSSVWGHIAAGDGLEMFHKGRAPDSIRSRSEQLGCNRESFAFVRHFVLGALTLQAHQFEGELEFSYRTHNL